MRVREDRVEDGPARGTAKLYVDKGYDALCQAAARAGAHVLGVLRVASCDHCGNDIPVSEQVAALDNGAICGYCEHRWNKVLDEE